MEVEIALCELDELSLGVFMANGEDDIGEFHMTTIGFLLLEVNFIRYKRSI